MMGPATPVPATGKKERGLWTFTITVIIRTVNTHIIFIMCPALF